MRAHFEKLKADTEEFLEKINAEGRRSGEMLDKLKARVEALEPTARRQDNIRKRFLEVYRRDVSDELRKDEETLTKIYGLDRERRKSLGKSYIPFLIVSLHAYITFYRP